MSVTRISFGALLPLFFGFSVPPFAGATGVLLKLRTPLLAVVVADGEGRKVWRRGVRRRKMGEARGAAIVTVVYGRSGGGVDLRPAGTSRFGVVEVEIEPCIRLDCAASSHDM